jgi:isopentenyl diphosphate isomerase/L-lactate dehydrogenase-like FMN-dependent dehydrogenase
MGNPDFEKERRSTMTERVPTVSEIYATGRENLKKKAGIDWIFPQIAPTVKANRQYFDSLFYETRFFNPMEVDTSLNLFNVKLKTPVFCSAISRLPYMSETTMADIAKGMADAGSLMMLGLVNSTDI